MMSQRFLNYPLCEDVFEALSLVKLWIRSLNDLIFLSQPQGFAAIVGFCLGYSLYSDAMPLLAVKEVKNCVCTQ